MTGWLIWAGVVLAVGTVDLVCWAIRQRQKDKAFWKAFDERREQRRKSWPAWMSDREGDK
jgi:hypothetical protein